MARRGEGPTLLECKTYRFYGHYVGDQTPYRNKEEAEDWIQNRDPLDLFETRVSEAGILAPDDFRTVDGEVATYLAEVVQAAEEAPQPDIAEVLTDVYVNYKGGSPDVA